MSKKYLYIILCTICIITAVVLCYSISFIREQEELEKNGVIFSHKAGFYTNAFDLKIKGKGDIYYTLDGSIPDENSIKYTGPIHISDASKNPNTISMREDISLMYNGKYKDFIKFPHNFRYYAQPKTNIDKCTIIRAVSISQDKKKSTVKSASYFVNFDKKKGYDRINVISVITDPKNLFDADTGIYVNGSKFDEWIKNNKINSFDFDNDKVLNFLEKGRDTEREAHADFFNANKKLIQEKEIGIRVQGASSRLLPQKSFNLYARREYDGVNRFSSNILDLNYSPHKMNLFASSQDYIKWYDYIVHSLLKNNKSISTLKFKPYALFLNGEYWGFYWLTEKYDDDYISNYYNIKNKQDIVIIKGTRLEKGPAPSKEYYQQLLNIILSYDFSNRENYEQIKQLVDIKGLIELYAVQIYINNGDFGFTTNNTLYKTINESANNSEYDKWHFMLYDLNSAFVPPGQHKYLEIRDDVIYKKIMSNKETKHMLAEKIIKLSLNEFEPEKVDSFIKTHKEYLNSAILKSIDRYYDTEIHNPDIRYVIELYKLEKFLNHRPVEMYNEYCKELDLSQPTDKKVKDVCEQYRK